MEDYIQITDYLQNKFSEKAIDEFDKLLDEKIKFLSENPLAFAKVNSYDEHLRKCLINNITVVYYDMYETKVEILALFDGRQNPEK
jgi:plasmid stabilization system protein ParE